MKQKTLKKNTQKKRNTKRRFHNFMNFSIMFDKKKTHFQYLWRSEIRKSTEIKIPKLFKTNTNLTKWLKRKSGFCPFFNTYPMEKALFRTKNYFSVTITSPEPVRPKTRSEVRKTVRVSLWNTLAGKIKRYRNYTYVFLEPNKKAAAYSELF